MKVILVPVSNRPESIVALQVAAEFGRLTGATISGCHLRPHRDADSDYKKAGLPLFSSPNRRWLDELDAKSSASATEEAQKLFSTVMAAAGCVITNKPKLKAADTAAWHERVGSPGRLMAILGPVADLVVVNRPKTKGNVAKLFMLAALMNSGRPVLILPQRQAKTPGKRILIAWNQSAEVARVVSACMPLLQSAATVTIVSCGAESRPGPKAAQLKNYMRSYGVQADVLVTRGHNEQAELMDAYADTKSDLMIMGAYSRSRLREVVFGGMTEFMLSKAKIPVIMQHN